MLLILHCKYLTQDIFMANIENNLLLSSNFNSNVSKPIHLCCLAKCQGMFLN